MSEKQSVASIAKNYSSIHSAFSIERLWQTHRQTDRHRCTH